MKTTFFEHNGKQVAAIGKSGSSAIARAILFAQQPEYTVRSASNDPEKVELSLNRPKWQALVPKTETPNLPAIPVRDPIERFRSACAQEGITADEALAKIDKANFHFRPTSAHVTMDCVLFKFPEHLDELAAFLGLESIDRVNDGETNNPPKPDLTAEQLTLVREIYADDIALYASIATAGQSLTVAPPEPEPEPVPTAEDQIRDLWAGLTADEKAGVYTYAPSAILAWERGEMDVMVKLILSNTHPEIADLKTAVESILEI